MMLNMKKLLTILGMITCMIGLSACGQTETASGPISEETAVAYGEATVQQMDTIVSQGAIDQYAEQDVVYEGLTGWQSALEDIGNFEGTDGGSVQFDDDEVIITVNVLGSDHDAEVEIILDSALTSYLSISTNVTYSFGELMKNAALNTLIGMGTVFIVLILISLIISCFNFIPKIQEKFTKKTDTKTATAGGDVSADPVVAQIAAKEELADDTELVAVIAAAIAAYEGAGSTDGFVVRSIRKSNKSKWQNA
jgi:sodium pump decarboxylase gamma subunit